MRSKFNVLLTFLVVMLGQFIFAQVKTVSGTVVDQNGLPLPSVAILEKGTTNGTQSDFDGNFKINVRQGSTLVFSYISMKTQEIVVNSSTLKLKCKKM
ncbi:MAG: hypothetical protein HC854_03795 [Flavobacterium sp.]|nr:hypothetical protein [Flavobacterium sp.]